MFARAFRRLPAIGAAPAIAKPSSSFALAALPRNAGSWASLRPLAVPAVHRSLFATSTGRKEEDEKVQKAVAPVSPAAPPAPVASTEPAVPGDRSPHVPTNLSATERSLYTYLPFGVAAAAILLGKEIYIMSEETVFAGSFAVVIFMGYINLREAVSTYFKDRANAILKEQLDALDNRINITKENIKIAELRMKQLEFFKLMKAEHDAAFKKAYSTYNRRFSYHYALFYDRFLNHLIDNFNNTTASIVNQMNSLTFMRLLFAIENKPSLRERYLQSLLDESSEPVNVLDNALQALKESPLTNPEIQTDVFLGDDIRAELKRAGISENDTEMYNAVRRQVLKLQGFGTNFFDVARCLNIQSQEEAQRFTEELSYIMSGSSFHQQLVKFTEDYMAKELKG